MCNLHKQGLKDRNRLKDRQDLVWNFYETFRGTCSWASLQSTAELDEISACSAKLWVCTVCKWNFEQAFSSKQYLKTIETPQNGNVIHLTLEGLEFGMQLQLLAN